MTSLPLPFHNSLRETWAKALKKPMKLFWSISHFPILERAVRMGYLPELRLQTTPVSIPRLLSIHGSRHSRFPKALLHHWDRLFSGPCYARTGNRLWLPFCVYLMQAGNIRVPSRESLNLREAQQTPWLKDTNCPLSGLLHARRTNGQRGIGHRDSNKEKN